MKAIQTTAAALASIALTTASVTTSAEAGTREDACAIWLCLPTGFAVEGCGRAKTAWLRRLARAQSPLPSWGSCSVNPGSTGSYETGREPYQQCRAGYVRAEDWLIDERDRFQRPEDVLRGRGETGPLCVDPTVCAPYDVEGGRCTAAYVPRVNDTPEWIEMTIDGQNIGRFYYALP